MIDGYPAGYVAQLARPLAGAGRSAAERTTRSRPSGLRLQTSARAGE
jgi:hypothetical protein